MKNQNSSTKRARINRMYGTDDIPSRAKIVYLYLEDRCYTSSECFPAIGTIGATTKTVEQAVEACAQGADYLGVGAIYPTTTKVKPVLTSTETLKDICNSDPIPTNAIGGLNKDNIDILKGISISGICVVSAIMKAENPQKATVELIDRAKELGLC